MHGTILTRSTQLRENDSTGIVAYLEDQMRMPAVIDRRPGEVAKDLCGTGFRQEGSVGQSEQIPAEYGHDLHGAAGSKVGGLPEVLSNRDLAREYPNRSDDEPIGQSGSCQEWECFKTAGR